MIEKIRRRLRRRVLKPALDGAALPLGLIRDFLRLEAAGGLVLIGAAALAILCASTALAHWYEGFKELPIVVTVGGFGLAKPMLHWVNDGLMALFFFLVGLEMKREILRGELSTVRRALLPAHPGRPVIDGDQAADQVQQQRQQLGVRPGLQAGRAGGAQQVISADVAEGRHLALRWQPGPAQRVPVMGDRVAEIGVTPVTGLAADLPSALGSAALR